MALPNLPDFNSWSIQELHNAETAAIEFLNDNIGDIADTFDKRLALMRRVSLMMRSPDSGFEERMLYLSLLQEISQSVTESAREFFEIGCGPRVASIVRGA